nr:hypothetical protein Iba_chr04aCG16440 [Ipomoea batatas]
MPRRARRSPATLQCSRRRRHPQSVAEVTAAACFSHPTGKTGEENPSLQYCQGESSSSPEMEVRSFAAERRVSEEKMEAFRRRRDFPHCCCIDRRPL